MWAADSPAVHRQASEHRGTAWDQTPTWDHQKEVHVRRHTARDVADVHLSPKHSAPASCFSRSASSSSFPSALRSQPDNSGNGQYDVNTWEI